MDENDSDAVSALVAVLVALGALAVLVYVLAGCAIALGEKSSARVDVHAPVDAEIKRPESEPKK